MSTKTLRKRVALIAVSAMGFGLITGVTPANAASEVTINTTSTVGLLSPVASAQNGLSSTATLLTTGTLSIDIAAAGGLLVSKAVVSAGAYISGGSNETIAADMLSSTVNSPANTGRVDVKTTGAAGSTFTVTVYPSTVAGTAATHVITVTVASASTAGVASAAKSNFVWSYYNSTNAVASVDSSTSSETTTGNKLYLHANLKDAYGNGISATDGALVVTASTGAVVGVSAAAGAASVTTYSTAVSNADPRDLAIIVGEATAGAGWSGTVTLTYNGVVIGTKSGKITGQVAKLEIEAVKVGKNNGSASADAFRYKATDAAGNTLPLATSSVTFNEALPAGIITNAAATTASTADTRGYGSITCGSNTSGSASITVYTTTSAGAKITSNAAKAYCGGTATTYSAKLDKAKYAQGDVATLTVAFKDSKGGLANSYDSVTNLAAANASISFPMAKQIGAISQADVPGADGTIAYKFNIGDVSSFASGKYNAVVTFGTPADGAAQTVAYEVSGAGGVSNSDILASIVKLITAINKQIAALQKLLLKK